MDSVSIATNDSTRPVMIASADGVLMQNHQPALPVSPETELASVYDANGLPLIFSFSPAGACYAVVGDPGSPTGWQQVDISAPLAALGTPQSFALEQLPSGQIFLALAIQESGGTTQDLYIASLPNDVAEIDWTNFGGYLGRAANPVTGSSISNVVVGSNDNGTGAPFIGVSIADAPQGVADQYIVGATGSGADLQWSWSDFPTPTAMSVMIDYAVGVVSGLGEGVYSLYQDGSGDVWLVFKTFTNSFGRSYVRNFAVPAGAAALQVAPPVDGTTPLFVGGSSGVWYFSDAAQTPPGQPTSPIQPVGIASAAQVPDVARGGLIVRADQTAANVTAIWALSDTDLYYLHSTDAGQWSTPILFRQNVTRVAPLRNQVQYANELIYLATDLDAVPAIYYMWQDPTTTLWKQDSIPIHATDEVLEQSTYTTHVSFSDGTTSTFSDVTFGLTADAWVRVVVNGATLVLTPDTPCAVTPDLQGVITIINGVTDLSAPLMHLTCPLFAGTIDVDSSYAAATTLAAVKTDSDIPVMPTTLPSGVQPGDVSSAISGMMQFHPASGATPTAAEIAYRSPDAAPPPRLNRAAIARGATFGVSFENGGFRFHDAAAVALHPGMTASLGSVGSFLSDAGGDILEYLKNVVDDVEHFVVTTADDVLTFVVTIAGDVASFAINTAEEVFGAVSWLFDKLEVAFDDLIDWLGFLFDWNDIVVTHRVMVNLVNQAIAYGQSELVALEGTISGFFDNLEQTIRALEPLGGTLGGSNVKASAGGAPQNRGTAGSRASTGSTGNYGRYHLLHSGGLSGVSTVTDQLSAPLGSFLTDVACPALQSVQDSAQTLFGDLKAGFEDGTLTLDQMIEQISGDVLIAVLDAIKTVAVGIVKLLDDLAGAIADGLNAAIDIPFVSALYEKYVGSDPSVLDCTMLLFAVPATVLYKIGTGEAPFASTTYGFDTSTYSELLQQLKESTGQTAASPAVAAARTALAAASTPSATVGDSSPSGCILAYANFGGLAALLTSSVYDACSLVTALIQMDAEGQSPEDLAEAKAQMGTVSLIQFALAGATAALTVPVTPGSAYAVQWAAYGLSWADFIKSAIAMLWVNADGDNPELLQKVLGLYEIAEGLVDIALAITIMVKQSQEADEQDPANDLLEGFSTSLSSLGTTACGVTRLTEGEPQLIAAVVSGGLYVIGGVLDFVALFVSIENGEAAG